MLYLVRAVADDKGDFSSGTGLIFDASAFLGGPRAKRAALVIVSPLMHQAFTSKATSSFVERQIADHLISLPLTLPRQHPARSRSNTHSSISSALLPPCSPARVPLVLHFRRSSNSRSLSLYSRRKTARSSTSPSRRSLLRLTSRRPSRLLRLFESPQMLLLLMTRP